MHACITAEMDPVSRENTEKRILAPMISSTLHFATGGAGEGGLGCG